MAYFSWPVSWQCWCLVWTGPGPGWWSQPLQARTVTLEISSINPTFRVENWNINLRNCQWCNVPFPTRYIYLFIWLLIKAVFKSVSLTGWPRVLWWEENETHNNPQAAVRPLMKFNPFYRMYMDEFLTQKLRDQFWDQWNSSLSGYWTLHKVFTCNFTQVEK